MAKKLLGIIGSPRKHGNSELILKELHTHFPEGWELELLRLHDFDIGPCRACYACLFGEMRCAVADGFTRVLEALAACDAYAVAAPAYLLGPNAVLKRFLDRGLSFYGQIDRLWAKPAVAIAVAGVDGLEGYTRLGVQSFVKLTMGDLRGTAVLYGALPGEVFLRGPAGETARTLARALLGEERAPEGTGPRCPLCGGDTFRFLSEDRVRCMLCSSSGSIERREGGISVRMERGEHPLFFTKEDALRHAEWLRGMKDKFLARRKELKGVTQGYLGMGKWIRPEPSGD